MDPFIAKLSHVIPAERLFLDAAQLSTFESDGLTAFAVRPQAVVMPLNEMEIVQCVKICNEHSVPFVARGSGTSLSGGSLPHADGIVIAMNRMNRILEIDPIDRVAVVEPGTINSQVSKMAERYGLHFAPDPSSQQVCTIGGNLAFNAGGRPLSQIWNDQQSCSRCSSGSRGWRSRIDWFEVDRVVGGRCDRVVRWKRRLAGYCYAGHVASHSKAGKLLHDPHRFRSVDEAGDAVSRIIEAGLLPAAMEIMDRTAMQAASLGVGAEYPAGAEAVLIVELDGTHANVVEEKRRLEQWLEPMETVGVHVAKDATERIRFGKVEKASFLPSVT